MKKIEATIVADSMHKGSRITTFLLTYPRMIHSELMTHRVFSRNSASSRAIPFKKMIESVTEDPFIPIAWQIDHKGMQGTEYLTGDVNIEEATKIWLEARNCIVERATKLSAPSEYKAPITKQLCNRLLEPFLWHTVLVTTTELENFFELRCPEYVVSWYPSNRPEALEPSQAGFRSKKDAIKATGNETSDWTLIDWLKASESGAEIHIQALAEAMWDAVKESTPIVLGMGDWHIPFWSKERKSKLIEYIQTTYTDLPSDSMIFRELQLKISVAAAARLSYMTMDGIIDIAKDIALYDRLLDSGHLSPFEHCATPVKWHPDLYEIKGATHKDKMENIWSANFKDWIQYRQLIQQQNESN